MSTQSAIARTMPADARAIFLRRTLLPLVATLALLAGLLAVAAPAEATGSAAGSFSVTDLVQPEPARPA